MFDTQLGSSLDVLSNALLDRLLLEQLPKVCDGFPKSQEWSITKTTSGYVPKDVKQLRVEFEGILRISNLLELTNLTKLQLNNNLIERIENIEMLVNLTWLDISHNNIEVIEGLETLTKLTDLSLQHNNISVLQGLDTLQELEVLSLGDNRFADRMDVLTYLKQFPKLKALSLQGNPLATEDPDAYITGAAALIPNLVYLDWKRITDAQRQQGMLTFAQDIASLAYKKEHEDELKEVEEQAKRTKEEYIHACVPDMYGDHWVRSKLPSEFNVLVKIPGLSDIFEVFVKSVSEQVATIGEAGQTFISKKESSDAEFAEALDQGLTDIKVGPSQQLIADTEKKMTAFASSLDNPDLSNDAVAREIDGFRNEIRDVQDELMDIEVHHNYAASNMMNEYERDLTELRQRGSEAIAEAMANIRAQEEIWVADTKMLLKTFFTNYTQGNAPEGFEAEDKLIKMMTDVETFQGNSVVLHDNMLNKIDTKEDEIGKLLTKANTQTTDAIKTQLFQKHRLSVEEIRGYIERLNDDLDMLQEDDEDEEETGNSLTTKYQDQVAVVVSEEQETKN
eukprot:m.108766 g.108766  ORF g.108766 m.108766 type:complete len:564 (+) comp27902_c0_seq1:119-1810(+)